MNVGRVKEENNEARNTLGGLKRLMYRWCVGFGGGGVGGCGSGG